MKTVRLATAAAALALLATPAAAGGFSFGSLGGNLGNWAYGDGAGFGGAEGGCIGHCTSSSESLTSSDSYVGYTASGNTSYGGNTSSFSGYGVGHVQSHSGAVSGSGAGAGIGFKLGGFKPSMGGKRPR
jgi:hypothetical protein